MTKDKNIISSGVFMKSGNLIYSLIFLIMTSGFCQASQIFKEKNIMKVGAFLKIMFFFFLTIGNSYGSEKFLKITKEYYEAEFDDFGKITLFLKSPQEIVDNGLSLNEIHLGDPEASSYLQFSNPKGEIACTFIHGIPDYIVVKGASFEPAKKRCAKGPPKILNGSEKMLLAISIIKDNWKKIWLDMEVFLNNKFKGVFSKPILDANRYYLRPANLKITNGTIILTFGFLLRMDPGEQAYTPDCTYEIPLGKKPITNPKINCSGGGL